MNDLSHLNRVYVITSGIPDADAVDITEGVAAMYDLLLSTMDWGSGFFTAEDAVPIAEVARAMGLPKVEEVDRYIELARATPNFPNPPRPYPSEEERALLARLHDMDLPDPPDRR